MESRRHRAIAFTTQYVTPRLIGAGIKTDSAIGVALTTAKPEESHISPVARIEAGLEVRSERRVRKKPLDPVVSAASLMTWHTADQFTSNRKRSRAALKRKKRVRDPLPLAHASRAISTRAMPKTQDDVVRVFLRVAEGDLRSLVEKACREGPRNRTPSDL